MKTITTMPADRHAHSAAAPDITWRKAPVLHVSVLTGIKRITGTLHLRRAPAGAA
jgi:hypothetical protein